MALEALESEELSNPLDRVERIAEAYQWAFSRTGSGEVTMEIAGGWSDMNVSLNWRDEFEILHVAVSLETKVPPPRRDEVAKLLARINEQLLIGHFDLWHADGSLLFRNCLLLTGNAEANDAQMRGADPLRGRNLRALFPGRAVRGLGRPECRGRARGRDDRNLG